jgi:DNA repair photolyase
VTGSCGNDSGNGGAVVASTRLLPLISDRSRSDLSPELQEIISYRKSGLSANWIVGCPLECQFCVRHTLKNWEMKNPKALMREDEAFERLVSHPYFEPHVTPIQLLNRATDPMLQAVKPRLFEMLRLLDEHGLTNHILVISRWHVFPEDCAVLNSFKNIKLTLLITHSGIDDERIEPVDSEIAAASLRTAYKHAERYRTVFYWRPIVPGTNDTDEHIGRALELSEHAHATVFTGLFYKNEIRDYYKAQGLPEPYEDGARRKIFPEELERRILAAAAARPAGGSPLFRKTSCGVTYGHGVADYNGHYGIRELCDICPLSQQALCAKAWTPPNTPDVTDMAEALGGKLVTINDRAVVVAGLDEERRYRLQHHFGYQIHDVDKPHHVHQHGRAEIGWPAPQEAS